MNHNIHKIVLTCFYQNNEPQEISSISFKTNNNNIERISGLNASYPDFGFCVQSDVASDRKNSLVCYIRSTNSERTGYCAVYNIDDNTFTKFKKYISHQCDADINSLTVDYYKETKEYIFSCMLNQPEIYIVKFDQNFDVIKINSKEESTLPIDQCYSLFFYSILFLNNEYTVIGDFSCDGDKQETTLYYISDNYKPLEIYSDIIEVSLNDDNSEKPNDSTTIEMKEETSTEDSSYSSGTTDIDDSTDTKDSTDTDHITNIEVNVISSLEDLSEETSSSVESKFDCDGYKNNEGTICSETIPIGYYLMDALNKLLGKCYLSCKSCVKGPEGDSNNCNTCKENFELNDNDNCLYKYNYYFDNTIDEIIYLSADQLCPEKLPYEIVETKECVETCSNKELMNKECKVNYFSENNLNLITNKLKNIINEVSDPNYDVIIDGNNIIYEITTSSSNNDFNNISRIDFGECENILKEHYAIDYLLVFKIDIKLNDSYPTSVQYEVYSPENKTKLDLSLCENTQIDVYVPVKIDNGTNILINEMNQLGFDILDKDNSFYNDICTPFTSDDGTDITLNDRQKTYYNSNIILCENSCEYKSYNNSNGKVKCKCEIKNEISEIKKISYDKMDINNFLDLKTISNIELIKCFKLTFSKKGINNNYGNIILISNSGIFIFLIIFYEINQKKSISRILRLALNSMTSPPKRKSVSFHYSLKLSRQPISMNNNTNSNNQISQSKQQSPTMRGLIETHNDKDSNKRKSSKKLTIQYKSIQNINLIKNENYIINNTNNDKYSKADRNNKATKNRKKSEVDVSVYPTKGKNYNKNKENQKLNCKNHQIHHDKAIKYNDYELNSLLYKEALLIDKRNYLQYYMSLIKTKHIILFIFIPSNDYNLIAIKLSLFIFSFCLYFTVNAFFFTDKTMHKIYEGKGLFNIISQLPHIFYSTIITAFFNILIKLLALSEKDVLKIKKIKNKDHALEKSYEIYKYLKIKFNIFFGISMLLLTFFWYYITTFCAVYKNTQITLIINTLACFLLSLIYPFALNLLPGIFRIPALKSKKKDKESIYNIGNILALL